MTKEEAISELIVIKSVYSHMRGEYKPCVEALQMAIDLLRQADTPQTEYPCETCANKGDHDGRCRNCVTDSEPIRWKTPSHYEPKQTNRPWK